MASSTANQLYPLSSQNGIAIPFEVIRPVSLLRLAYEEAVNKTATIPAIYRMGWIWASSDCFIKFGGDPFGTEILDGVIDQACFIPGNTVVTTIFIPGPVHVWSDLVGFIVFNAVEQWASLLQPQQLNQG